MRGYRVTVLEPETPDGKGLYGICPTQDGEDTGDGVVRRGLQDALFWIQVQEGQ